MGDWSARCSLPNQRKNTAIAATAIVALPMTISTAPASVWAADLPTGWGGNARVTTGLEGHAPPTTGWGGQ